LGFLDLVKITGDSNETGIDSMAEDRSVILQGSFHKPQAEMSGTFGMPQMGKLDIHLKCPEYKDKAKITVLSGERNGATVPTGIHFENEKGDFKNDYSLKFLIDNLSIHKSVVILKVTLLKHLIFLTNSL
jgi:hypothetical protein